MSVWWCVSHEAGNPEDDTCSVTSHQRGEGNGVITHKTRQTLLFQTGGILMQLISRYDCEAAGIHCGAD